MNKMNVVFELLTKPRFSDDEYKVLITQAVEYARNPKPVIKTADDLIRELRARATPHENENTAWVLDGDEFDEVAVYRTFDGVIRGYWDYLCECYENPDIYVDPVHPSQMDWSNTLKYWEQKNTHGCILCMNDEWTYAVPLGK